MFCDSKLGGKSDVSRNYWLDENQTETGHKVIYLLRFQNVLGLWKWVTFSNTQRSFADWRIFGIFKNDQNFHILRYFQNVFFNLVKYTC